MTPVKLHYCVKSSRNCANHDRWGIEKTTQSKMEIIRNFIRNVHSMLQNLWFIYFDFLHIHRGRKLHSHSFVLTPFAYATTASPDIEDKYSDRCTKKNWYLPRAGIGKKTRTNQGDIQLFGRYLPSRHCTNAVANLNTWAESLICEVVQELFTHRISCLLGHAFPIMWIARWHFWIHSKLFHRLSIYSSPVLPYPHERKQAMAMCRICALYVFSHFSFKEIYQYFPISLIPGNFSRENRFFDYVFSCLGLDLHAKQSAAVISQKLRNRKPQKPRYCFVIL